MSQTRQDHTSVHKFAFVLTLDNNVSIGEFSECSGLSIERETKPYSEGGLNDYTHTLPGRLKHSNITLKRGVTTDSKALWKWFDAGRFDLKITRRDISIKLLDVGGETVRHWDIRGAYPIKITAPTLNSGSSEAAIETLELAHKGIQLSFERK
ncbi:MAG: phage tail protein [Chloroflexi bacterium]|nr:phage tail protein [Chloroflexota bacterium]